jgi:hypothetical protein
MAGVLTHVPGLVYLAALNAIVNESTGILDGVAQVGGVQRHLVQHADRGAGPVGASSGRIGCTLRSADLVDSDQSHGRAITVVFCGGLGTYLLVSGVAV